MPALCCLSASYFYLPLVILFEFLSFSSHADLHRSKRRKEDSAIAITRKHAVPINSHYLRSHFTIFVAFLLLNTFLSIAYFAWGGVINPVLCLAMPGLIYIPPSDMVMIVTS
jgi:hypothetical protein